MGRILEFVAEQKNGDDIACMSAVAEDLARETGARIALFQMPGGDHDITEGFDGQLLEKQRAEIMSKTGLAALFLTFMGERLSSEKVRGCAFKTLDPGIDIFHAAGFDAGKENREVSEILLKEVAKAYDLVLVTERKSEGSDRRLVLLPQSRRVWKKYFETKGKRKGNIYAVRDYMKNSVSNKMYFELMYGEKLFTLRNCAGFMDALSEGNVPGFFRHMKRMGKLLPDYGFTEDVRKLAEVMIKGGRDDG